MQNCLKFSAALGQISLNSSKVTLPNFCLLECRSKKTTGLLTSLMIPAIYCCQSIIRVVRLWAI